MENEIFDRIWVSTKELLINIHRKKYRNALKYIKEMRVDLDKLEEQIKK